MPAYVARARACCFICELLAGTSGYEHEVVWRDVTMSALALAVFRRVRPGDGHHLVVADDMSEAGVVIRLPVGHREPAMSPASRHGAAEWARMIRPGLEVAASGATDRFLRGRCR
jgi:hypothetical protein